MKIKSLLIIFSATVKQKEIDFFRGALIQISSGNDVYHNHTDDGYIYRYPLIQYKRVGGKAAVMAIGEAVNVVGEILGGDESTLRIGSKVVPHNVERVVPSNILVQTWNTLFSYSLHKWLPLNKDNYEKYRASTSVVEKVQLLERILTANILSMCKGLGVTIEDHIVCSITHCGDPVKITYKGTSLMSFDVEFLCNVSIPDFIGLGKGASHGHGLCKRKTEYVDNQESK